VKPTVLHQKYCADYTYDELGERIKAPGDERFKFAFLLSFLHTIDLVATHGEKQKSASARVDKKTLKNTVSHD
jgi:hypothetical protein